MLPKESFSNQSVQQAGTEYRLADQKLIFSQGLLRCDCRQLELTYTPCQHILYVLAHCKKINHQELLELLVGLAADDGGLDLCGDKLGDGGLLDDFNAHVDTNA